MTGPDDPSRDLSPEEREVAARLEEAFAAVVMTRPSPAADMLSHGDTALALLASFSHVSMSRPAPSLEYLTAAPGFPSAAAATGGATRSTGTVTQFGNRPGRRRAPYMRWALGAAAACAVTSAVVLLPAGTSTAWAATPRQISSADRSGVDAACSTSLRAVSGGSGALQGQLVVPSGGAPVSTTWTGAAPTTEPSVRPGASTSGGRSATVEDFGRLSRLPSLVSLDVRASTAFAVYRDGTGSVVCLAREDRGTWVLESGIVGDDEPAQSEAGTVSTAVSMTLADGTAVTTLVGKVPAAAARVSFRLADGTTVEASVGAGMWAAWIPGDRTLEADSLTVLDRGGRPLPL